MFNCKISSSEIIFNIFIKAMILIKLCKKPMLVLSLQTPPGHHIRIKVLSLHLSGPRSFFAVDEGGGGSFTPNTSRVYPSNDPVPREFVSSNSSLTLVLHGAKGSTLFLKYSLCELIPKICLKISENGIRPTQ